MSSTSQLERAPGSVIELPANVGAFVGTMTFRQYQEYLQSDPNAYINSNETFKLVMNGIENVMVTVRTRQIH